MFKKWIFIATLAVVVTASLILTGCQGSSNITTNNQATGIFVTAEGKVSAVPDLATVTLGITAQAATVAGAQSQAASAMNAVMAALNAKGVAERDIQTSFYNISELTRWDSVRQQSENIGFQVTNNVTVKIRDLDKTGEIIDSVVAAGGDLTRVNNIRFSVEDREAYYAAARAEAVQAALSKAEDIARLAGVRLGTLTYITESTSSYYPAPVYYERAALDSAASTPVSPGEIEVTLNIQATFAIR